jgi:beta-barrel assembly-enhancing protease
VDGGTSWAGVAYHSSLPRGQSDCRLALAGKRLVARLPNGESLTIALGQMEHQRGGADRATHVFTSTIVNGPTFTTSDAGAHAAVSKALAAGRAVARRPGRFTTGHKVVLGVAGGLVAAALLAVLVTGPLARAAVDLVPSSVDRDIGRRGYEEALASRWFGPRGVRTDPPVRAVLDAAMARLEGALGRPDLHFVVTVMESPMVNAFALPDGHILVTTGLLQVLGSTDELAAVLAHEVSHVVERHVVELLVRRAGLRVILMAVTGNGESLGRNLIASSASLAALGFNRSMEARADDRGTQLLGRALIDPASALRVMERFRAREEGLPGSPGEFLRTHPLTGKRIEAIAARIARLPPVSPLAIDADWEALRRAVDGPPYRSR